MKSNTQWYVFVFVFLVLLGLVSCTPIKSILLGRPDAKDMGRFTNSKINSDTCFLFEKDNRDDIKITDWSSDQPVFKPLLELCHEHSVRSFIVIQNDTIKFEYYRDELDENSLHPSYSISKSMISCLVGIAIDEGWLQSVNQKAIDFIPEIKNKPYAEKLTIKHLLNHTSGIKYSLIEDGNLYYGKNIIKELQNILFVTLPGTNQEYLNVNSQLLGIILARSSGMSVTKLVQQKIWAPIGMCNEGHWSVDKYGVEKSFCCLSATAKDYAKFGRLYLNRGLWNKQRVFSESWYEESMSRDTTDGSSHNYNYSWHLGLKEYGDFMAIGLYKQHLYIYPKKNLIIVLLNDREKPISAERVNWWFIFRQIGDEL